MTSSDNMSKGNIYLALIVAIFLITPASADAAYYYLTPALRAKMEKLPATPVTTLKIPVMFGVSVSDLKDTWSESRSGGRTHEGVDIFAPTGTPVASPTEAVILGTGFQGYGGNYVFTANPGDEKYYYAHLDSVASTIKVGSVIKAGDIIGYVGNTGNGEGGKPHLHFGIYKKVTTAPINPFERLTQEFTLTERTTAAKQILISAVKDSTVLKKIQEEYITQAKEVTVPEKIPDTVEPPATSGAIEQKTGSKNVPPPTRTTKNRILKAGLRGNDVKTLQTNLNNLLKITLKADGVYGKSTADAVRRFQKDTNLIVTGIAGAVTQAKIAELLNYR